MHTILVQSVNILIAFYHGHLQIKQKVKFSGYLMMSMNGEHSKMWDILFAKLIHLTDPECGAMGFAGSRQ